MKSINYSKAINQAIYQAMEKDSNVICYGLGTDDPKGVFGTTLNLQEKFGASRVFDMPTSENAMTGVAVGAALNGIRSIMTHQRVDFFLLAMDQLVNHASKWHYMFGGKLSVPITIRLIIGHGWGQGPTHSQSLQSWFAHIPGLKVVMPTSAYDAKGMLLSSIFDDNPVIFLEHRWLHGLAGNVPEEFYTSPLSEAKIVKEGTDITLVSHSYMTIESMAAVEFLEKNGVSAELIDLRSIRPIDWNLILKSVKKTGRILAIDSSHETMSVSSEIIARTSMELFSSLKAAPQRMGLPDIHAPTSFSLTKVYYNRAENIIEKVANLFHRNLSVDDFINQKQHAHDVPGDWFKGPF